MKRQGDDVGLDTGIVDKRRARRYVHRYGDIAVRFFDALEGRRLGDGLVNELGAVAGGIANADVEGVDKRVPRRRPFGVGRVQRRNRQRRA